MAVLMMNNDEEPRNLPFAFNQVPGLRAEASNAFKLYAIWAEHTIVESQYGGYGAMSVPSHGSVFLKISNA